MSKPICTVCVGQLNVRTDRFICNACGRQCHSQCLFEDPNFKEWDKTMLATALKFVVSSVCKVDAAKAVKTNAKHRSLQQESRRIDEALDAYKTDAQRRLIEYVDTLQCKSCWRYGHIKRTCTYSPICKFCGGPHTVEECQSSNASPQCANCIRHNRETSSSISFNHSVASDACAVRK